MDAEAEREFREYVVGRQAALFRTALLLTGHLQFRSSAGLAGDVAALGF